MESAGPPGRGRNAVVIPAFCEEKHIGEVVRRTRAQLDHVLVVDDGSTEDLIMSSFWTLMANIVPKRSTGLLRRPGRRWNPSF